MTTSDSETRQVRNSVIYLVPTVVTAVSVFVTLPIFTRLLTVEEYGALALATAYGAFASGIATFGLAVSYERNFFQFEALRDRAGLLYATLTFVLVTHAALVAVTWWFRDAISLWLIETPGYGWLLVVALSAQALTSLKSFYLIYLRNTHDAAGYVRYTIDDTVVALVASAFCVVYLRLGIIGVPLGQVISAVVVLLLLLRRFARQLPMAFSTALLKESLRMSYPLTPRLLVGVLGNQFDKYMLARLGSVEAVGLYSIAQRFAFPVFTFTTALGNVFVPHVYEKMFARKAGEPDTVGHYLTPYAYVSFGGALAVALFAEELVRLLTAPAYHSAAPLVSILAIYYGILFFGKQPQLMFAKKTFVLSVLSMVSIASTAVFVTMGISWFGAAGAAWGTVAAGVVLVVLAQYLGQRHYAIAWDYRRLSVIVGMFLFSSVLAIFLASSEVSVAVDAVVKAVCVLVYIGIGVRLGFLNRSTYTMLHNALPESLHRRSRPSAQNNAD